MKKLMLPELFLLSHICLGPGGRPEGGRCPVGCPQTGVMLTAGSPFSISNQCLACCGLVPRLSIIQELGNICCLMQDLLLFNRTKPWWVRFSPQGSQVSRCERIMDRGIVALGRGLVQTAYRADGRREKPQTKMSREHPEFALCLFG